MTRSSQRPGTGQGRLMGAVRSAVSDSAHDLQGISLAQRRTALIACAFGVPTLLCLWVYTLLYKRENVLLLYLPLVLAVIMLGVTLQALNSRAAGQPRRGDTAQARLLSWSILTYTVLCLLYRTVFPQHFNEGLNLLVGLLVVITALAVCVRFRPFRAGLTLTLLMLLHSLPLLLGMARQTVSGGPLLLSVVTELMLSAVLALMYSSSWTQLALGHSEAASLQMEYLSRTDHLTRLSNRRSLYSSIEALMADVENAGIAGAGIVSAGPDGARQVYRPTFSIVLLDIDHFKNVNDTFGHATGDAVLCGVAEVLESFLRQRDVAGRWGGEEFLLVIPGVNLELATRIAERLRIRVADAPLLPGQRSVTASFGVTCWQPGDSLEALMARADAAMYRAKRGGRNRVEVGTPAQESAHLSAAPDEEQESPPAPTLSTGLSGELTGTDG